MIASTLSPLEAEVTGVRAKRLLNSAIGLLRRTVKSPKRAIPPKLQRVENAGEREARVTRISICPRRVLLYLGEEHTLSPLPLDNAGKPVHGVVFSYESTEKQIATVATDGSLTAVKRGECFVTTSVGQKRAKVKVEVREGPRPNLTRAQWDAEHANDCEDPERDPETLLSDVGIQSRRPATKPTLSPQLLPPPDEEPPPFVGGAGERYNSVGHPRFSPDLTLQASPASNDNQLGSYSFNLSIPIFSSGGRGVGTDVSLVYNSRVWTKDVATNTMVFDYEGGWPTPGFRLNYGRIIPNYNVASGNGDYLLIEADGTRTPLLHQTGNLYRSNDGRHIEFLSNNNKLFLPNGTLIRYEFKGGSNSIFPTLIRDIHGNSISISYVANCADAPRVEQCDCSVGCTVNCCPGKPPRQAIKQITDTLGRHVTFYYYANGHLAEIRTAGYNNAADRVVAKFYYETRTMSYNFGTLTVVGVPSGGQLDVLKRIYIPETGRGYLFDSYSGYGMFARASMRLGMTDASDGTEIGYTEYTFLTTGALSDSPQISERREWWQGKTDDSGNTTTAPAVYTYSRTSDSLTMTSSVSGPSGTNSLTTIMISDNSPTSDTYGLLKEERIEKNGMLLKQEFFYDSPTLPQGLQRKQVKTTDDGSPANQTQTDFVYGQYGRLIRTLEYGFRAAGGSFNKRRRTEYEYLDTSAYIAATLYHLVTSITVWDAKETNDDSDDMPINKTAFEYDAPDPGWEIQKYGFTIGCQTPACPVPPGYDTGFVDATVRGLVTKVKHWSNADAPPPNLPDISFRHAYDIFGNEVKAEISCCSLKRSTFSPYSIGMFFSLPIVLTDGPISGPNLQISYSYDYGTSFLNLQVDSNNLVTSYAPDSAMRVRTVTYPKLTSDTNPRPTLETFYVNDLNNESSTDTLAYESRFTYFDGTQQKVQISNQWFDGAGRVLRQGSSSGPTITSFDAVKSIYDDMGRLRKSTTPYNTTNPNGDTTGLPNASTYDYDGLSRLVTLTFPGTNTIVTDYSGALTTVTDQVGRQRRSEVDGLGRTVTVTEMDASKQLTQDTIYGYDKNDNLTSVNQGGQTRAFKYDSLSRMTFERTVEQAPTIDDGVGTLWSAKYTYTEFNAVLTRQDARGVITNYAYDGLNRLSSVSYETKETSALDTASVTITYGGTVPKLGQVVEVKQTDSSANTPWKETYDYDSLSRINSKTVSFDNQAFSYTTLYGYNQAGQLETMTYPSSRLVNMGYDSRGRMSSIGGTRSYINSVGYNPAQQVSSIALANGVNEGFTYNDRLQLSSQTAIKGPTTLMNLTYFYSADQTRNGGTKTGNSGQLMDITGSIINSGIKDQAFNYDQVGRLVQASGWGLDNLWKRRYTYDRWGNRPMVESFENGVWCTKQTMTFKPGPNGEPLGNAPRTVKDFTQCGSQYVSKAMTYDLAGDVTGYGAQTFSYDGEARLVQAVDVSGGSWQYGYDAANRRVKKVGGGATTRYVWEGSHVIAEYNGAGVLLAEYVYAGDRMLAREMAGAVTYYHQDRLSVRLLTDGAGNWIATQSHEPFGEQVQERDEGQLVSKWRFTNYERDDEPGTDYAVNRQYLTGAGRFIQPDPLSGTLADPQSLNRYAYARGDAVNLVDPLGLFAGYCPPQYQSCGEVMVCIDSWCLYVGVGFSGGGHADFLWGQLPIFTQLRLSDFTLPKGFDIFPSFGNLVRQTDLFDRGPGIIKGAQSQIQKLIAQELQKCNEVGAQTFQQYLRDQKINLRELQARGSGWQAANNISSAVSLGRALLSVNPPGIAYNALSTFGVLPGLGNLVTWQDLLYPNEVKALNDAEAAAKGARKSCRKKVHRKFGS